jgi:hypothetical protein
MNLVVLAENFKEIADVGDLALYEIKRGIEVFIDMFELWEGD